MALPKAYLTSVKNLPAILTAIQQAQAPERFTQAFLESLEFKSSSDRLIIGVLKSLGFLDDNGIPTDRYYRFLDQTQSKHVLAEGVRDSYADLFKVNKSAQNMSKGDLVNKFKTLSQGKLSDSVLDKLATTFTALVKQSDFSKIAEPAVSTAEDEQEAEEATGPAQSPLYLGTSTRSLGGVHYNIQLILPDSRDPKVFDALFRSLREHLF